MEKNQVEIYAQKGKGGQKEGGGIRKIKRTLASHRYVFGIQWIYAYIYNKSSNLPIFIIMYHLLSKLPLILASDLAQF